MTQIVQIYELLGWDANFVCSCKPGFAPFSRSSCALATASQDLLLCLALASQDLLLSVAVPVPLPLQVRICSFALRLQVRICSFALHLQVRICSFQSQFLCPCTCKPGFAPFSRSSCAAAAGALTTDCPSLRRNAVQLHTDPAYKSTLLTLGLYAIDGRHPPSVNQSC